MTARPKEIWAVIPAKAGIQRLRSARIKADSRFRGNDARAVRSVILAIVLMLCSWSFTALAQPATDATPLKFESAVEEKRFHALVEELRCVMCQNNSLAESNAQIAVDLRREVLELMRQGKSDREIKEFLVDRYGEFVLYRPQVESKTWLLWFGPALVLLAGGVIVVGAVRRRSRTTPAASGTTAGTGNNNNDDDQEW